MVSENLHCPMQIRTCQRQLYALVESCILLQCQQLLAYRQQVSWAGGQLAVFTAEEGLATTNTTIDHGAVDDAGNFVVHLAGNVSVDKSTSGCDTRASVAHTK